jgi:hypothetical protein
LIEEKEEAINYKKEENWPRVDLILTAKMNGKNEGMIEFNWI